MIHVKVCGITRLDDAELACELGASALGFVFWPGSPRFLDPFRARPIVAKLPPFVVPVGVFVDQPIEYVMGVASLVPLGALQLHGRESHQYCELVRRPVIKAVGVAEPFDWSALEAAPARAIVLLDVHDLRLHGGTGQTIDWTVARRVARKRPTILAGGLRADNVAAAIQTVRPYAIDVSSGVERAPGIKDPFRLRSFFVAVAAALEETT